MSNLISLSGGNNLINDSYFTKITNFNNVIYSESVAKLTLNSCKFKDVSSVSNILFTTKSLIF